MGVYPESFMSTIRRDVGFLLARVERANPPGDSGLPNKDAPKPKVPMIEPAHEPGGHGHAEGEGHAHEAPEPAPPEPAGHTHAPGEEHR
jgi:NADH-quinone oxidoreductase subunit M